MQKLHSPGGLWIKVSAEMFIPNICVYMSFTARSSLSSAKKNKSQGV